MPRFTARLIKEGFGATVAGLPADLMLIPLSWSASDRGGCKMASLSASGSGEALMSLTGWLGDRIEIFNAQGDCVWYGVLWDMEIAVGNVMLALTLDSVYNKIAVIYPHQNGDGSLESRRTTWAEDANSIARYGARELLYGMPESFSSSADAVRDQLLERFKTASPIISSQGDSQFGATLTGMGIWHKAASIYFTNADGLVEHQGEGGSMMLGRNLVSTGISFGTLTPGTPPEADEMWIVPGNFDPLDAGDNFTVTGAAVGANNDTFTIAGQDASNQISISGSFAAEAAGATVKISYGDNISYDNIAMSFVPANSWIVTHVAVKVRQVNSPTDSFRIGIYPDSAGIPGTFLTANETLGSALYTELTWTEFAFATPVALTGGTTYWLNMRRTGTVSLADGYEVAIDEDLGYAGGQFKVYNGASWITRTPDADMPFRVIGEISSTEQIEKAIAVVDAFDQSLIQVDSLIPVRQYSADEVTALDTIEELLDAGASTGVRLVAWVTRDDTVIVGTQETAGYGESNPVLGADGRLRYGGGGFFPPGQLIYGKRVDFESLQLLDGMSVRASRGASTYVQESSYDATTDILTVESEGAISPWQALSVRKG